MAMVADGAQPMITAGASIGKVAHAAPTVLGWFEIVTTNGLGAEVSHN
jgi:hypothetical protein